MAITFFTQSKKDPAPIYIRIREGVEIDAKARTDFYVNHKNFNKGKILTERIPPKADEKRKLEIKTKNKELIKLQDELDKVKSELNGRLNNRKDYEIINSDWLKAILNPKQENNIPNILSDYFYYYRDLKKNSIKESTLKQLTVFGNRVKKYEKEKGVVYIQKVNKSFSISFQKWMDEQEYNHNTKVNTLKKIKTVCNHAKANGIATNPEYEYIIGELKYKRAENVYLNLEELKKIEEVDIQNKRLDIARDWLLISCFTAQRISDFLGFSEDDIIVMEGKYFLDINQKKTEKPVYIPLMKNVLKIIKKYNGFPPQFSKHTESNKTIYNELIKEVCRLAGIRDEVIVNRPVKNGKHSTKRYEIQKMPKYKAVSSHIGRRSFATNYYGKIRTSLLISATGHSTEKQFLDYVGKVENINAIALATELEQIDREEKISKMRIIKTASNE